MMLDIDHIIQKNQENYIEQTSVNGNASLALSQDENFVA